MAFEALPGIRINDIVGNKAYIVADYFSYYADTRDSKTMPAVYKWSDFKAVTETSTEFILDINVSNARIKEENDENAKIKTFHISKDLFPDPATQIRIRAIIEGIIAINPQIEYRHGKRILPVKSGCVGCEIPPEAYIATGGYRENEINSANAVLKNSDFGKLIWIFAPIVAVAVFILQITLFGSTQWKEMSNFLPILVISVFAGLTFGITVYLVCIFASKTLYGRILKEDVALLEEITFVVCEDGFIAAESEVYDFSDIILWRDVAYFIETANVFILFSNDRAVFWLPKRLFPKEMHTEIGDFIADKLQQKGAS